MFVNFVFGIYDSRPIRGLLKKAVRRDVDWEADQPPRNRHKEYVRGIGHPATAADSMFAIRQWGPRWPKSTLRVALTKQGKFGVIGDGGNFVPRRAAVRLRGTVVHPRSERLYSFHQNYLGLFTYRFAFDAAPTIDTEEMLAAVRTLGETSVVFRVGTPPTGLAIATSKGSPKRTRQPQLVEAKLQQSPPILAILHSDSCSKKALDVEARSHVLAMPPLIFVHDLESQIAGWTPDVFLRGQRIAGADTFVLRPAPQRVSTQRIQSYIAAHLMEGFALREMAEYVRARGSAFRGSGHLYAAQTALRRAASARKDTQNLPDPIMRKIATAIDASHCRRLDNEFDVALQTLDGLKSRRKAELLLQAAQP